MEAAPAPPTQPSPSPRFDVMSEEEQRGRRPLSPANEPPFFGSRREQSPLALEREHKFSRTGNSSLKGLSRPNGEFLQQRGQDGSFARGTYDPRALAPPRSPFMQRTPSPRSMSDSSDDGLNPVPVLSPHRKLSGGSGISTSPISPSMFSTMPRSPSISSETSIGGTLLPRPAFNFSRPLSRASASGLPVDILSRQASSDSQPSFVLADDTAHTPVSMHSEVFPDYETGGAPSYVYARFSLPRGKMLQRNSLIFQENMPQAQYSWEQSVPYSNVQPLQDGAPPSPPSRPSISSVRPERPSLDPGRPSVDHERPSYDRARPSTGHDTSSPRFTPRERSSSPSAASSSTIQARSQHSLPASIDCSAEEHVSKAIEFHEAGALTKSTYHLRLAARQNHPTGMLLYALACRHGWGMRPNQKEGVAWLRKAADSASLEIAEDEGANGITADYLERKERKAQFALSIYELGVSHMNGWGIDQDKILALRCFEIAGSWGDADALAEAGYCYAQGIGCKKDLKKSARLYRQAEAKGISMVGNSWIYKPKYADDADGSRISTETKSSPEKDKKPRNKSRTRTIFGRANHKH
ncbi:Nim1-interacting factor 1 [Hyphodiscus hymeniophilus]|uniref:Nim1-interacting factor 1 n=1 Tax=Hyphodiscus hymeniophilus TaxID=353542 RepID=A0A9P6VNC0_9HELO|nr:Nim1-interacting factor 1 [Hyphodiscus hymeniophilus]